MTPEREAKLIGIIEDCHTLEEIEAARMSLRVQGESMTTEVYRAMQLQIDRINRRDGRRARPWR